MNSHCVRLLILAGMTSVNVELKKPLAEHTHMEDVQCCPLCPSTCAAFLFALSDFTLYYMSHITKHICGGARETKETDVTH